MIAWPKTNWAKTVGIRIILDNQAGTGQDIKGGSKISVQTDHSNMVGKLNSDWLASWGSASRL